ncbi:MAG: HAD family phosphatase [Chloroflexi bacterium]|nr:HAD family phosphatase [Chloroflexota bacterium]
MGELRAAIFDIGGVLTSSPVTAIRDYAAAAGIDYGILGPMLALPDGTWSRYERSELTEQEFCLALEAEGRAHGITVDGKLIQQAAFAGQQVRPEMIAAVRHLKGKVRLGAITNNVLRDDSRPKSIEDLDELFECVIESAKVGMRKPDPRIFHMACESLGVTPPEAVFLDDLGANLKGARALGMTTIKVDHTLSALLELEAALGIPLPKPAV